MAGTVAASFAQEDAAPLQRRPHCVVAGVVALAGGFAALQQLLADPTSLASAVGFAVAVAVWCVAVAVATRRELVAAAPTRGELTELTLAQSPGF